MQDVLIPNDKEISTVSRARLMVWCVVVALSCGVGAWLWGVGSAQRPEASQAIRPPVLISPNHRVQVLAMVPVYDVQMQVQSRHYRLQGTLAVMGPVNTVKLERHAALENVVPTMADHRTAFPSQGMIAK